MKIMRNGKEEVTRQSHVMEHKHRFVSDGKLFTVLGDKLVSKSHHHIAILMIYVFDICLLPYLILDVGFWIFKQKPLAYCSEVPGESRSIFKIHKCTKHVTNETPPQADTELDKPGKCYITCGWKETSDDESKMETCGVWRSAPTLQASRHPAGLSFLHLQLCWSLS